MYACGICNERVVYLNKFDDCVGNPPFPIYQIIRKCTRGSRCKYIEEGVCNVCANDLASYHDAVTTAKLIKRKLLDLIENEYIIYSDKPLVSNNTCDLDNKSSFQDDATMQLVNLKCSQVFDIENNTDLDIIEDDSSKETEKKNYMKIPVLSNKCDECGEVFADRISCKIHKEKNHVKGFVCELCGKVVKSQKSLRDHRVLHSTEKPFECRICGQRFHFELRLNIHMTRHTSEKPFKCETCGKCFRDKSNLSGHRNIHKNVPLLYECKICNKGFRNASRLKYHEVKHNTEKKYFCKYCNRGFTTKYYIPQHLKDNKKCSAAFQNDKNLNPNTNIYEDWNSDVLINNQNFKKPIEIKRECNICGKTFLKSSCLSNHMFIHAKENDL